MIDLSKIPGRLLGNIAIKSIDECWLWLGSRRSRCRKDPYGGVGYKNKNWLVHRLVYHLAVEKISRDRKVLHRCDNTLCVNPHHLFAGTQKDNVDDMCRKARNQTRLNPDIVREMRQLYVEAGLTTSEIAEKFNHVVNKDAIAQIVRGDTWKWVDGPTLSLGPSGISRKGTLVVINGEVMRAADAARKLGMPDKTLHERLKRGKPLTDPYVRTPRGF